MLMCRISFGYVCWGLIRNFLKKKKTLLNEETEKDHSCQVLIF